MTATTDPTLVILKNVLLSYPWLDKAQPPQDEKGKAKFSAALVITPEQQKEEWFLAAVEAAKTAAVNEFGAKAPSIPIFGGKNCPIRNDTAGKGYPEGSVIIGARNEQQPGIVYPYPEAGTNKPARMPQDKIKETMFPGVIVNAQVRAYGYNKGVNKGVTFSLQNIQYVKDGPRLDNRQAAEDAFGSLSEAPADISSLVG